MKRATHNCPACPNQCEGRQTVCRSCWKRLPHDMRKAIMDAQHVQAFKRAAAAGVAAVEWLVEHPVGVAIARVTGAARAAPP